PGDLGNTLPRRRARQRPWDREGTDSEDLWPAALWIEISPAPPVARAAGNWNLGRRHVRPAHDGKADHGDLARRLRKARAQVRDSDRHAAKRAGRGRGR